MTIRIILFLMIGVLASCGSDSKTTKADNSEKEVATTQTPGSTFQKQESQTTESKTKAEKLAKSNMQANNENTSGKKAVAEYAQSNPKATKAQPVKKTSSTNVNKNGIPDACDLLSQATISKYLNVPAAGISVSDGSSKNNDKQRACFFKWDGSSIKNAGVMVQVQQNQVADEVPEYLTYMVSSLKTEGENDFQGGTVMKYYDWPGFGDDGAYSTEAGKYVWRVGNDWAFMVAFNTELSGEAQKKAARAFAKEVMQKMKF